MQTSSAWLECMGILCIQVNILYMYIYIYTYKPFHIYTYLVHTMVCYIHNRSLMSCRRSGDPRDVLKIRRSKGLFHQTDASFRTHAFRFSIPTEVRTNPLRTEVHLADTLIERLGQGLLIIPFQDRPNSAASLDLWRGNDK